VNYVSENQRKLVDINCKQLTMCRILAVTNVTQICKADRKMNEYRTATLTKMNNLSEK